VSALHLATEAARNAIQDAGLTPRDIDGIILFFYDRGDPLESRDIAANLGIPEVAWQLNVCGGGNNTGGIITTAAAAIQAGLCSNVVCLHAGTRFSRRYEIPRASSLTEPFGLFRAPQQFALAAQRHMHEYGTKHEHLGAIALACRKHAMMNPRALMREPLTMEGYLASRMISSPLRVLDCCVETDAGAAVVVTSNERAKDLRHHPVELLSGVCNASGPAYTHHTTQGETNEEYTSLASRYVAKRLWEKAGVGPEDMDFGQIYDCFSYTVLAQLEDLGFCGKGEGGPFVENGTLEIGGKFPINTSGGHLSEGYVRGMTLVNEAVRQLRHEYEGTPRQVENAELGVVTSAPMPESGMVLARA
jgi:acetyl-CoA acetyltransferase